MTASSLWHAQPVAAKGTVTHTKLLEGWHVTAISQMEGLSAVLLVKRLRARACVHETETKADHTNEYRVHVEFMKT